MTVLTVDDCHRHGKSPVRILSCVRVRACRCESAFPAHRIQKENPGGLPRFSGNYCYENYGKNPWIIFSSFVLFYSLLFLRFLSARFRDIKAVILMIVVIQFVRLLFRGVLPQSGLPDAIEFVVAVPYDAPILGRHLSLPLEVVRGGRADLAQPFPRQPGGGLVRSLRYREYVLQQSLKFTHDITIQILLSRFLFCPRRRNPFPSQPVLGCSTPPVPEDAGCP